MFSKASRPALGIQWVPRVKLPMLEADHTPISSRLRMSGFVPPPLPPHLSPWRVQGQLYLYRKQQDARIEMLYKRITFLYVIFSFTKARQPLGGLGLLIVDASRSHSHTPHSVALLWTSGQPDAETCT